MLAMRIGFALLWGIAGSYLLATVRRAWVERRDWQRDGVDVEGEVVDFETRSSPSRPSAKPYVAPVVKYRTQDGGVERFTSAASFKPNPFVVGQRVLIRYRRDDPTRADLTSVTKGWFMLAALLFAAVVCLTVASLPILLSPPVQR
jgi:hypothetical protein